MTTTTPQTSAFYFWFYEYGGVNVVRYQTTITWTLTPTTFDWGTTSNLSMSGTYGSIATPGPGQYLLMPTLGGTWYRTSDDSVQAVPTISTVSNPWTAAVATDYIGYVQLRMPSTAEYVPGPGWQYGDDFTTALFMADDVHGDTVDITGEAVPRTVARMRLDVSPDGGAP